MPFSWNEDDDFADEGRLGEDEIMGIFGDESDHTTERWESDIAELECEDWERQLGGPDCEPDEEDVEHESLEEDDQGEEEDDEEEEEEEVEDDDRSERVASLAERCVELQREIEELVGELNETKDLLAQDFTMGEILETEGYRLLGCMGQRLRYSVEARNLARELRDLRRAEAEDGRAELICAYPYVRISRLPSDIRTEFPNHGCRWLEPDVAAFRALLEDGIPLADISQRLGRPPKSLRAKRQELYPAGDWPSTDAQDARVSPGDSQANQGDSEDDDDIPF